MSVQNCARCMAPLPIGGGPPGAVVRCRFCGTDNRMDPAPRSAAPAPAPEFSAELEAFREAVAQRAAEKREAEEQAAKVAEAVAKMAEASAKPTPAGCYVVGAAVLAAIAGLVYWIVRPLPLDRLSEEPSAGEGWVKIGAPPPPGGFGGFDPTASIPWAHRIARSWARDAVFLGMRVDALRPNGKADVVTSSSDDASGPGVSYDFASPARLADYRRRARHKEIKVNFQITLQVTEGHVQVLRTLDTPHGDPLEKHEPLPAHFCPLSHAIRALVEARKIPERPLYSANLNGWAGFSWSISTRDDHTSGSVSAETCKVR